MANPIKYNTSAETLALKKGNFYIGTGDVGKGPTSSTGYYDGVTPPSGGFTIYLNKASNGPAIYTVSTEAQLTSLTNKIAGTSYTTSGECLTYFATQTDKMIFNKDCTPIITNGIVLNMDAGFTPSYPTAGTTWYNVANGANNGTFTNGVTYNPLSGGSMSFDGVDDYIDVTSVYPSVPTEISIESYFRLNSYSNLFYNEFKPRFAIRSSSVNLWHGTDAYGNIAFSYNFTTGVWYHIVLTFDTTNKYLCYVNGVSLSRTYDNFAANGIPGFTTTVIGSSAGSEPYFNGNMQSAKFYNRALSQSEILKNYFATIPIVRNGLVLSLEAGNPTSYINGSKTWVDTVSGVTASLINGPTFSSSGASSSILFDGTDDYAPVASYTPPNNTSMTLNIWTKATSNPSTQKTTLMSKWGSSTQGNFSWLLFLNWFGDGNLYFLVGNSSGNNYSTATMTSNLSASQYVNFSVTYDSGNINMYRNGTLIVTTTSSNTSLKSVPTPLTIGADWDNGSTDTLLRHYNGNIAISQIYNRALNATEILQNFNSYRTAFGI
jgi:hypothetical protein